jgi:spore germination cell wall hydrolase CwlJ-like protein
MDNRGLPIMKYFLFLLFVGLLTLSAFSNDKQVIACTLILEAGGEYAEGAMQAVHEVILNRADKRNLTPKQVCLQPKQFSCWNSKNYRKLIAKAKAHPRYAYALSIVHGERTNITGGADHYHAKYVRPYWASSLKKTCTIGNHIFYK